MIYPVAPGEGGCAHGSTALGGAGVFHAALGSGTAVSVSAAGSFCLSAAPVSVADSAPIRMWVFNGRAGAAIVCAPGRGAIS